MLLPLALCSAGSVNLQLSDFFHSLSYTDGWLNPALSGMNMVDVRISVPVKLTDEVTLTPYIGGVIPLEALDAGQDDKIVAGASLSVTF
jgi:hypothetical protein